MAMGTDMGDGHLRKRYANIRPDWENSSTRHEQGRTTSRRDLYGSVHSGLAAASGAELVWQGPRHARPC